MLSGKQAAPSSDSPSRRSSSLGGREPHRNPVRLCRAVDIVDVAPQFRGDTHRPNAVPVEHFIAKRYSLVF